MSLSRHPRLYVVDCDVSHVRRADLAAVNALARAAVNARRCGARLRVVNASQDLQQLITFAGLADVLLGRIEGKVEEREEAIGVEERVEPDDASS
jgi:ABC-type transporter Mla MlaB component